MTDPQHAPDGSSEDTPIDQSAADRAMEASSAMNALIAMRPVHGFRRNLGYTTTKWAERFSEVQLTIDHRHDNSHGIVHGGVYAAMLDAAFGGAVAFCGTPGHMRSAVTITLQTIFMAPAKRGVLTATGRVLGVEGRVATCAGEIRLDDGTLCATGTASFMYLHGSEQPDGIPVPPRKNDMRRV